MNEREIFFEALEMPTPEARAAYLQGACGRDVALRRKVDELLKEHFANDSLLAGPAVEALAPTVTIPPPAEVPAQMLGRYKLLEKIGEGGFGEVWMAEQREPVKRRVALKLIKLGMDSRQIVARFEAERQALAMMDHPNIAKIFDAGTTGASDSQLSTSNSQLSQGRPYFVMELVRGIKITEYCDQNQLTTQQRLDLFIKVCQAIQHAHQKGIIHRDIKPSNILVTLHDGTPVPKVIDFGIAKATQGELTDKTVFTQFQQFIGTPAYISPEQAEMSSLDIDTRADIYSLGVLLYELLVGQTPFDAKEMMQGGLDALRQIIREREPLRPSTKLNTLQGDARTTAGKRRQTDVGKLVHQLQGDLDWIVMKCLEKDRTRRYDTANGLAMDIQRHLNSEPVIARPPSTPYKVQKFVRRNKLAFAAAVLVAGVLVLGVVVSTWQAVRATRAERHAQDETKRASLEATRAKQAEKVAKQNSTLAEEQNQRANKERERAEATAKALRKSLYLADMNTVQQALQESNLGRAAARLNKYFPKPGEEDLRGLEWRYLWKFCQGDETFTLHFNDYPVNSLTFSPDGRLLAMTSLDNKVTILDVATKRVLTRLNGLFAFHNCQTIAFSPDGKFLAASDKGGVNLWRTTDWQLSRRLEDESMGSNEISMLFSPDGQTLTTASNRKLSFWDFATGREKTPANVLPPDFTGYRLAYSADGKTVAVASKNEVELWDVASGSKSGKFTGKLNLIMSLAWSSDWLAAGTWEGDLNIWDLATSQLVVNIKAHPTFIFALAFSPDGKSLATGGGDQKIYFWDVASLKPQALAPNAPRKNSPLRKMAALQGHLHEVWAVAFSPDGQTLASGGKDGTARFWSAIPKPDQSVLAEARLPLRFSDDGNSLLAINRDGTLSDWDVRSRQKLRVIDLGFKTNQAGPVTVSSDGKTLAVSPTNGAVELWNLETQQRLGTYQAPGAEVDLLKFAPKDKLLASRIRPGLAGESKRTITILNLAPGQPQEPMDGAFSRFSVFAFSPDETLLAVSLADHSIVVRNLATRKDLAILTKHTRQVFSLAFSLDGRRLISASVDNTLRLWDTASWKELDVLHGHMGGVMAATFSSDGNILASISADKALKLWDVSLIPAQELISVPTAPRFPKSVMLSPGSSVLAVYVTAGIAGGDEEVLLLRAPSLAECETIEQAKAGTHVWVNRKE